MDRILQLASQLISSENGGLVYHLILTFSITGALIICLYFWNRQVVEWRRLVFGLSLLLLFQVFLISLSALAWQGLINPVKWFPLFERMVSLLGLLVVVWLWAFPRPSRSADIASIILVGLVLTVGILAGVWWSGQLTLLTLNNTWIGLGSCILGLLFLGLGIVLLFTRKPTGWEMGFGMLAILCIGYLLQFLWGRNGIGFSPAIRLAELVAYPFLLVLPQRFLVISPKLGSAKFEDYDDGLVLMQKALKNNEIHDVFQQSAQELATAMKAEFCFLFTLSDDSRSIEIRGIKDRRQKEQKIDRLPDLQSGIAIELTGSNFPLLVNSLQLNRPLRLPASSNSPDMVNLVQLFQLNGTGHLLLFPATTEGLPPLGIALLSPISQKSWSQVDVQNGGNLIQPVARFLQQSVQVKRMEYRLNQLESEYRVSKSQKTQEQAQEELSLLRKADLDKQAQIQTLAALISLQQESLTKTSQKIQGLQAELADRTDGLSRHEVEVVLLQAQELRQPLSTIQEYSNFLLSESMGVLGTIQRKFIDGIRQSSERVNQISRDLEENLRIHSSLAQSEWMEVDLGEILDNSVNRSSSLLRSKRILLKMDLPEHLPTLITDRQALSQIMDTLVLRAAKVSPSQGQVALAALVEENNGKPEYVIVQIRDSSGGLTNSELPDDHDTDYQAQQISTDGPKFESDPLNGQGNELSMVQNQVETLNGRIWLDNDLGRGTTVNMLLPVITHAQWNSKLAKKGNSS